MCDFNIVCRNEFPSKFPFDSSEQSEASEGSSGDYAEIGPALMNSVHFHATAPQCPHYSEINDITLPPLASVYDEPDLKLDTETATSMALPIPCHNYSKLERKIPPIYVTSESDASDKENDADSSTTSAAKLVDVYSAFDHEAGESSDSSDNSTESLFLVNSHHLPTILEHPYHILEEPSGLFDMDYQTALISQDFKSVGYKSDEKYEYDRLVDPQLYSILERPTGVKIYDVQSGPYSKLEGKVPSKSATKRKTVAKLNLSSEVLFDDAQYVSPIPTPNFTKSPAVTPQASHVLTPPQRSLILQSLTNESSAEQNASQPDADEESPSKYRGDYERDPIYMENIPAGGNPAIKKSKPASAVYQPLEPSAMDPTPDYENCLKPDPLSTINHTKTAAATE